MPNLNGASTERVFVFPDTHLADSVNGVRPMDAHDPKAISVAIQVMRDFKPTKALQLGDLLNNGGISSFQRRKDQLGQVPSDSGDTISSVVARDMALGRRFWDIVQENSRGCKEYYQLCGNHDHLLNEARGMAAYKPFIDKNWYIESALQLKEKGIKYVPYIRTETQNNWVELGKLWAIHGSFSSGNALKKHYEAYGKSLIMGHLHAYIAASFSSVHSGPAGVWSLGTLSTRTASYIRSGVNAWRQGFGTVHILPNKNFYVNFYDIIDGVTVYNGKVYSAKKLTGLE